MLSIHGWMGLSTENEEEGLAERTASPSHLSSRSFVAEYEDGSQHEVSYADPRVARLILSGIMV